MADTAGYPPDASAKAGLGAHSVPEAVHTNKRKRDSRDSGAARPAPAASNNTTSGNTTTDMSDQATASYLAAHNASTNEDDMQQQFDLHQNGGPSSTSAGDTAAAALAHYSMTVPQATEISFQTQNSSGDGTSFSMGDHSLHQQQGPGLADFSLDTLKAATQTPRSTQPPTNESPPTTSSGHKPPVGSEEWHKVRRDNHKEGECMVYHSNVH